MTTLPERAKQAVALFGSQQKAADAIREQCGISVTQAAISKVCSGKHGDDPGLSVIPLLLAIVARFNVLWMTRGRGPRDAVPQLSPPASQPTLHTSLIVDTVEGPVELTSDAIHVARAFMALPANKREDFKRNIEIAALEYLRPIPDHQLEHLRAPAPAAAVAGEPVTVPARRGKRS